MNNDSKKLMIFICIFAAAASVLLGLLILIGAMSGPLISENPPASSQVIPIPPSDNGAPVTTSTNVQLYFRFGEEGMLACETRSIQTAANQRLEYAVLRELIRGPSTQGTELERVISSQTQIVSITEQGDTLYVTFNNEFLRRSSTLPDGWGEDTVLREEEYLRRRLAVHSVVNTLTGLGTYSHVQILIDTEGNGIGQTVTRGRMGFLEDMSIKEHPLEPRAFEDSVVLTPENTVSSILQATLMHDWQSLYSFISPQSESGFTRPLYDSAAVDLQNLELQVESYQVLGVVISADGKSAVVRINLVYRNAEGERIERISYPIKLRAHNEIWKVDFDRFLSIFTGA